MQESSFKTFDGTELFYRAWRAEARPSKAVILFHRGHEHSGRFEEVATKLDLPDCAVFAWDARGHGRSPGERGWAPSFGTLVHDADCFVKHVNREHGIATENIAVLAHSIGAVVASAWVHDYAPPIRAMVLASPAFEVKLYVPFALFFLRLQSMVIKKAFVKSYVRPGMLTHDPKEAANYASDPLISRNVAVNLLVSMHDTARRIVGDASAIRTPTLVLSSGSDFVVKLKPQRQFFERLHSPVKEMEVLDGFYHDLLHETARDRPISRARAFIERAFERPPDTAAFTGNESAYRELTAAPSAMAALMWGAQRVFLKTLGKLSRGIQTGWQYGFDSGESLDYVYRNRAEGITPLGRMIDYIYLNSPGWNGIRKRRENLEALLQRTVSMVRGEGRPVHIFDPAAGGGRYVLETVKRMNGAPLKVALRDWSPSNVEAASKLARHLQLTSVAVERGDAFDRRSLAAVQPRPSVAIVSGLYELFPDNARVGESLAGISDALDAGSYFIYTNQPWHPQLEMIARVLDNRDGKPWIMRCRPQAEMDALVKAAGFEKIDMLTDEDGIFTVSLARRLPAGVRI